MGLRERRRRTSLSRCSETSAGKEREMKKEGWREEKRDIWTKYSAEGACTPPPLSLEVVVEVIEQKGRFHMI